MRIDIDCRYVTITDDKLRKRFSNTHLGDDVMPIINVDCWEGFNEEQKKEWIKELTVVTNKLFNIPPDKILVILRDTPLANWGQAGIVATDPNFLEKSRITEMESEF
jgi:4-oxalocrotonate tautomerase family enzyme